MDRLLIWQLATRYLRGKRSANAVPILSRISMVAIAVSSCAMIIVFSAFNGLESIIKKRYNSFYPDIKISAVKGKFFTMDSLKIDAIRHLTGVKHVTGVIEDQTFATNRDQHKVITLKGISNDYFEVNNIRPYIIQGDSVVSTGYPYTAIVGHQIMSELGADINTLTSIQVYYQNPAVTNPTVDPLSAFQSLKLHPAGEFALDEFDDKYVLAPLSLVQELFSENGAYSAIEISATAEAIGGIKQQLQSTLGSNYRVETRYEQNKLLYSVMITEKWATYFILLLVLLIASFNMVGALSMLVLEKQKDIAILRAMGAFPSTLRKIFLLEGVLWALSGGLSGMILGFVICLCQQKFEFIKLGLLGGDAYPLRFEPGDVVLVIFTILMVGLLASWYPSIRATKAVDPTLKGG